MAAFGRPGRPGLAVSAAAGAFAPDASLYGMAAVSLFVLEIPAETVFRDLYYSAAWQQVFAIDNSIFLWCALLALAVWRRWSLLFAFAGAGLLHLALDFPLHNDDARMHFWPVTAWVFESPVSYWDSRHWGDFVWPLELGASLALCAVLFTRFRSWAVRLSTVMLGAAEIAASGIWGLVF